MAKQQKALKNALLRSLLGGSDVLPQLPLLAAQLVADDTASPALVALAGLSVRAPEWELRATADDLRRELQLPGIGDAAEREKLVAYIARNLISDPMNVGEYSAMLRAIARTYYNDPIMNRIQALVGLASSWDEPWSDELPGLLSEAAREFLDPHQL
ncbi:hypothetical protein [Curtobacterium sp. L1-20]|uniref:hypothetical protein n=1 Tax=Curtobacterium sp. L1-20 TaxID=3138181 RepID=UPI003B518239